MYLFLYKFVKINKCLCSFFSYSNIFRCHDFLLKFPIIDMNENYFFNIKSVIMETDLSLQLMGPVG